MDNELFELCKSVYEKTGWRSGAISGIEWHRYKNDGHPSEWQQRNIPFTFTPNDERVPLYTSDYLLEKLPRYIEHPDYTDPDKAWLTVSPTRYSDEYAAGYEWEANDEFVIPGGFSDTPLKALLKLTLALHEAGELTTKDEIEPKN